LQGPDHQSDALLLSSLPTNGCPQEADLKQISEEISSSSKRLSAEEVFSRCESSVLRVEVDLKHGGRRTGTAFVTAISGEISILTNRHVVDGAREIRVTGLQGQLARVESYRESDQHDLAILKVIPP
jgi:S1-C subfamily serine protease